MKKIEIFGGEQQLSLEDVEAFEGNFDVTLPSNFVSFILKHNGGYISVDDEERDFMNSFNSIKYGDQTIENAIESYSVHETILDKHFLPIANSYTGNPVCLCLKEGDNYGKVVAFYFDRDEEPDVVADSLEELLGVKDIEDLE